MYMYIFLYACSTPLERDEWLKALNDAISENTKRRKSFDVRTLQQSISVNVNVCNILAPFQLLYNPNRCPIRTLE